MGQCDLSVLLNQGLHPVQHVFAKDTLFTEFSQRLTGMGLPRLLLDCAGTDEFDPLSFQGNHGLFIVGAILTVNPVESGFENLFYYGLVRLPELVECILLQH